MLIRAVWRRNLHYHLILPRRRSRPSSKWAGLNAFPTSPQTVQDDKIALVNRYGNDMETWLVKGQGHGWPGKAYPLGALAMGPQLNTVDATAKMWQFLSRYRLP